MFGLIGSIERQTLISNVKLSMNAKARSGEAITGRVLGYKLSLNPLHRKMIWLSMKMKLILYVKFSIYI